MTYSSYSKIGSFRSTSFIKAKTLTRKRLFLTLGLVGFACWGISVSGYKLYSLHQQTLAPEVTTLNTHLTSKTIELPIPEAAIIDNTSLAQPIAPSPSITPSPQNLAPHILPTATLTSNMTLAPNPSLANPKRVTTTTSPQLSKPHAVQLATAVIPAASLKKTAIKPKEAKVSTINQAKAAAPQLYYAAATIQHSLSQAIKKAGLSQAELSTLTTIFTDQFDVHKIHPGDYFQVLYQANPAHHTHEIVAAKFTTQGKTYRAIRYVDAQGHVDYYTPEGQSLRHGFLRYPVHFTRIGSGFSHARLDPILQEVRPHEAVDFDAPLGTPIKATGNGRIASMGNQNGYGNTVVIKHAGNCSTLYAHMSRFAQDVHPGSHVKAGQVIGYVGQTGMATGPHVHYEYRINGVHYNPLTVRLPTAPALSQLARNRFIPQAHLLMAQLETNAAIHLASNANLKHHG